jgi:hypothetical protein
MMLIWDCLTTLKLEFDIKSSTFSNVYQKIKPLLVTILFSRTLIIFGIKLYLENELTMQSK